MKKNFKQRFAAIMLVSVMLMSTACSNGNNGDKGGETNSSTPVVNEGGSANDSNQGNVNNGNSNAGNGENSSVQFSDFLVERCVRKQLNKNWDEKITATDLKNITSLVIDNTYDPTFFSSIERPGELDYTGYIDLVDLKYLTNLEELKIDAYDGSDTVVNVESITNCKKLKKISIPCSLSDSGSSETLNRLGYSYWTDIVAKLPELEYMDLGIYVDAHMKEVILSKAANKNIEISEGIKRNMGKVGIYKEFSAGYKIWRSLCYSVEAAEYATYWTHEYLGIGNVYVKDYNTLSRTGVEIFPYIEVKDQAELESALNSMGKDVEDIIVVIDTKGEVDFAVFEQFEDLVSLTIYNKGLGNKTEKVWDDENGIYKYVFLGMEGAIPVNLEKLSGLKKLQVINLGGFLGDLSDLTKLSKLREVSIVDSQVSGVDFIGELKGVKELTLSLTGYGQENAMELDKKLDEEVCSLSGLKMYREQNKLEDGTECFKNIENMKSLETLFTNMHRHHEDTLDNITDSDSIKNLKMYYTVEEAKIQDISFEKMDSLENLVITGGVWGEYDYENILKAPNLISVRLPLAADEAAMKSIYTSKTVNKIKSHGKLSAFYSSVEKEYKQKLYNNVDRDYIKELYDAGIEDGIYRQWAYENSVECEPASIESFLAE